MRAKVGYLAIDSVDRGTLAPFWGALLSASVARSIGEGDLHVVPPAADGLTVGFQRASEGTVGRNRRHADPVVDDGDAGTSRVGSWGGRRSEPGRTRDLTGLRWRVMVEPEGDEPDLDTLPR
jgi:hypothetical protein